MFIRVHVESRDLELQSNNEPLLLASLESAFPGAVGLSVRATGSNAKRVLHFDGNSFHAPAEGWTSVEEYEVTLGGRNLFPFGSSYENASKQLEQTVRTIQSLMTQNEGIMNSVNEVGNVQLTPPSPRDRRGSFRNRTGTFKNSQDGNQLDFWLPRKGCDEMERQFAELSALVSGKDSIIKSLRQQVQTERAANEQLERLNSSTKLEAEEWQLKWKSLDSELRLLRDLGSRQESVGQKIKQLNSELENVKNSSNTKIQQIQETLTGVQQELNSTTSKYEQLRRDYDSSILECRTKERQLEDLRSRLATVTSELAEHRDQSARSHELQERLCRENIALAEWSKKLELENKEHEAELDRVRKDFEVQHNQLQESYNEKCEQSAQIHKLVESLNKKLVDLSRKHEELRESIGKTVISPRVYENGDQNPVILL